MAGSRVWLRLAGPIAAGLLACGCASPQLEMDAAFPPDPTFAPDHRYTLDDLIRLSVHRNAGLDVARYEADAVQGLVDQVKSLWLPMLRYNFAAIAYDNDLNYKANAFNIVSLDVPITGTYNIVNSVALAQILATFGKRTSGLKQAKMYQAILRLQVLVKQDGLAQDVATYYHFVCLTSEIDAVLEDSIRRLRVFHQVAAEQNRLGSLRVNQLDSLQAELLVSQLEQLRVAIQAGRRQAYAALRQAVGVGRDEPLELASTGLPPAVTQAQAQRAYEAIVLGFGQRPELHQVDLFAKLRAEQVNFAKAAWAPNIAFVGSFINISGNNNTILGVVDGLIASIIIDWPLYDPARRAKLREALALEQAAASFQRQIEELIALEIEVTSIECQRALVTAFKTARALELAAEHYDATRQAYSRELVPASAVAIALAIDTAVKVQHLAALFAYHNGMARLKRVTADREAAFGY